MRFKWVLALATAITSVLLAKSPVMSHEESVVRTTYARLAFAVQVEEIYLLTNEATNNKRTVDRAEFATRLKDAALQFELSDFKVGELSQISQVKYSDLVTKPEGGEALSIHAGTWNLASDKPMETHSSIATVRWTKQQNILKTGSSRSERFIRKRKLRANTPDLQLSK